MMDDWICMKRSVGTLYVYKIFPNKIKLCRNERFVEKRVPRNAFRRNAICVENFPKYNKVPYERKVCRNYDNLENAFRRNAMCVDTTSQRKSFPQSYKNHKKLYLKFLKFVHL